MTLETEAGISRFRFSDDRRGIGNMVLEFCSSIVDDRPPPMTSGEVGLRDLKVVIAAYQSAARGTPVRL